MRKDKIMEHSAFIIRNLDTKDYSKVVRFAIKGMHLGRYTDNSVLLKIYGRYFFLMELGRATQVLAAYDGDKLVGVLMAQIYGKAVRRVPLVQRAYVALVDKFQRVYAKGADAYDQANKGLYQQYRRSHEPEGEITFLTADPDEPGRGVGSALLAELERREPGKELFVYTDDWCSYQFYEHRGFQRFGEQMVTMDLPVGKVPIDCYLYRKRLVDRSTEN